MQRRTCAAPAAPSWGRDLLLLALLFAGLFAIELGTAPLANPDESRYAEIPREMVVSGDWVTPRLDGVVYFGAGLSIVHAVDARTGKLLWRYDPKAASRSGPGLRVGWGSRGIAWWNGKIYAGTQDGRLIAVRAKSPNPETAMIVPISTAPR